MLPSDTTSPLPPCPSGHPCDNPECYARVHPNHASGRPDANRENDSSITQAVDFERDGLSRWLRSLSNPQDPKRLADEIDDVTRRARAHRSDTAPTTLDAALAAMPAHY